MTRLYHYSAEPFEGPLTRLPAHPDPYFKPSGIWVTPESDDNWFSWCRGEDYALERLAYRAEIRLHPEAIILQMDSPFQLDQFTHRYRRPETNRWSFSCIDWPRVADEYQGILIVPYIYERRLDEWCQWYYSWDCASGCIWDPEAVESVVLDKGYSYGASLGLASSTTVVQPGGAEID